MFRIALVATFLSACALTDPEDTSEDGAAIESANAWYTLASTSGLGPATLVVANGYKVHCPDGQFSTTCHVTALTVPATCGFECTDGLLGLQGDSLVRGTFSGTTFVIAEGFDTFSRAAGQYSSYRITGAPSCAQAPCPTGLVAQKLNIKTQPTAVQSVDFSHAIDPNYVLDPTRGDDQIASPSGLLVTGHVVSHVFRAERVFRLETSHPACDVQLVARAHAYGGGDDGEELRQFRTEHEAEWFVPPVDTQNHWLVRTGESPTSVTFTSGTNDLWAVQFAVAKSDCAITTLAEH